MPVVMTAALAERQLNSSGMDALIKDIPIPPRPVVVQQMQAEMARPEPDLRRMADIVSQDVGLTLAVLKTVNSPMYGLSRRAESVDQAVNMIGLQQLNIIVTAMAMRALLKDGGATLARFYDTSARRAYAMARMARATGLVDVGLAQTFGLFCDVGIPLLAHRFPNYLDTLKVANQDPVRSFTAVEQSIHHTDHALVGALMVKSWELSPVAALAIRLHHDYEVFIDPKVPVEVSRLISLCVVAEQAIQRSAQIHDNVEWAKGGDYVASTLAMSEAEVHEWIEQLIDDFAHGID